MRALTLTPTTASFTVTGRGTRTTEMRVTDAAGNVRELTTTVDVRPSGG